jgi:hypothetical protein
VRDPLTVAFVIPRPWPKARGWTAQQTYTHRSRFWAMDPQGMYWPALVTVWHRGRDEDCTRRSGWRLHLHHWRFQVHPLQKLRRRLLTRCTGCGGRSTYERPVNIRREWPESRPPWWRGEAGLSHIRCEEGAER